MSEPSLAETIEWAHKVKESAFLRSWNRDKFYRLVEAGEFEERNASKAFDCYNARSKAEDWRCPLRDKFDRRIEELEKDRQGLGAGLEESAGEVSGLRRQLDDLGKEKAEVERHAWKLDQDIIELVKDGVRGEDELERLRKSDGCKACQVCPYVTDLETAEKEVGRLERELERLQLDWRKIRKEFTDRAIDIAKKLLSEFPAPAPTEAEVEKLAVWLFEKFPLAGYHPPSKFKNLKPYQKDMMMAHVEKLLATLVPRSEHEQLVGAFRKEVKFWKEKYAEMT